MIYSTLGYRTLDPVYLRFKKNWSHPVVQNVQPETLAYDAILFFVTFLLQFFNESYILSQEVYITIYCISHHKVDELSNCWVGPRL